MLSTTAASSRARHVPQTVCEDRTPPVPNTLPSQRSRAVQRACWLRRSAAIIASSPPGLPLCGGEVAQQPGKSLLIRVISFPAPKVANVPRIADQRWPARLQGHDRVVDSDRKQEGSALLAV